MKESYTAKEVEALKTEHEGEIAQLVEEHVKEIKDIENSHNQEMVAVRGATIEKKTNGRKKGKRKGVSPEAKAALDKWREDLKAGKVDLKKVKDARILATKKKLNAAVMRLNDLKRRRDEAIAEFDRKVADGEEYVATLENKVTKWASGKEVSASAIATVKKLQPVEQKRLQELISSGKLQEFLASFDS